MMHVRGELVVIKQPIVIRDLSRTGFAAICELSFDPGETLDFRLEGDGEPSFQVSARAVHSRPVPGSPGLFVSGFTFIPGPLTGLLPQALIDRLIESVTVPTSCFH